MKKAKIASTVISIALIILPFCTDLKIDTVTFLVLEFPYKTGPEQELSSGKSENTA